MKIKERINKFNPVLRRENLRKQLQEMRTELDLSQERQKKLQMLIIDDLLTARESTVNYRGNEYQSYSAAVTEIDRKYRGLADWGVLQTGAIIDLRAAFIISQGIKIIPEAEGADREVEWAESFLRYNDLDKEVAQEFAKEAEIEGKFLGRLALEDVDETVDKNGKMISVRFVSWTQRKYTVITAPHDYMQYKSVSWKGRGKKWNKETLEEDEFVYKRFGGRIYLPNESQPRIMKCLTQIDDLDKARRDLREINRLFAAPTPFFECETEKIAEDIMHEIAENPNFKIKKAIAARAKFSFVSPDMKGAEVLIEEILSTSKIISGNTGIPVHFLGLLDLLKNRATGESTRELVMGATSKDREIWKGGYEEIITKGMIKYNNEVLKQKSEKSKLDPRKIRVEIAIYSQEQWDHIEKVLTPLLITGNLSREYVLSQIPGLDMKSELRRQEKKMKKELDDVVQKNKDLEEDLEEKEIEQEKKNISQAAVT